MHKKHPFLPLIHILLLLLILICIILMLYGYTKQTDPSTPVQPERTDLTDPSDDSTETEPIRSDGTTAPQETQHTTTGSQASNLSKEAATAQTPDTEQGNTEITKQEATDMTQTSNGAGMNRITYRDGFYQETLSDTLIERMTGSSYHENDDISLDQLRFLHVLYYDFNNEIKDGQKRNLMFFICPLIILVVSNNVS